MPLGRRAGHAWIDDSVHQALRRTNALRAARQPPRGRRRWDERPGYERGRRRVPGPESPVAPSDGRGSRASIASLAHAAAAATHGRREGGRLRVAVVDSATPPGRPTAAATAQVAVEHGARRRAEQAPSPPCGSARQQPPIPRLGRWLVGAALHRAAGSVAPLRATYISNVAAERVRERVWGTLPRTRPRHAAHRLSAFQVPHVLAPLAYMYFDNVCDPPLLPGTSVIAPRLCAHCALSTVPHALSPRRARVSWVCCV